METSQALINGTAVTFFLLGPQKSQNDDDDYFFFNSSLCSLEETEYPGYLFHQ